MWIYVKSDHYSVWKLTLSVKCQNQENQTKKTSKQSESPAGNKGGAEGARQHKQDIQQQQQQNMTTQSPNRVYSDANFLTRQDFRGSNNPLVTPYPPPSHPYMMGAFLPPPPYN